MAILGKLVDRYTASRAGDDLHGVTVVTAPHSLPATNAEVMIPVVRSVQELAVGVPLFVPLAVGSNASLSSIGWAATNSTASMPTIYYNIISVVFHSVVR